MGSDCWAVAMASRPPCRKRADPLTVWYARAQGRALARARARARASVRVRGDGGWERYEDVRLRKSGVAELRLP